MPLPVPAGTPVTLGYRAKARFDPNYVHRGVDYGTRTGTPVTATRGGKVIHAGTGGLGRAFGVHVVVLVDGIYTLYAHLSRADVKRGATVIQGQRLGLSGATGNVTGAHLHYAELTRYHYQADRRPLFLEQAATVRVTTAVINLAGNHATLKRTGGTRARRYVARRRAIPVDVVLVQEATVSSGVRGALDRGLERMRRAGGGDGRYAYLSTGCTRIAGGVITAARSSWYRGDDKQAAYVVYTKQGLKAMDVGFHLESDSGAEADRKRIEQINSIRTEALAIAKRHGVPTRNILFAGDTNSRNLVRQAMAAAGWADLAAGTKYATTKTHRDGRIDYAFGAEGAGRVVSVADDLTISDHAGLRVERTLVP